MPGGRGEARGSDAIAQDAKEPAAAFDAAVSAKARAYSGLEEAEALSRVVRVRLAGGGIFAGCLTFTTKLILIHGFSQSEVERHTCNSTQKIKKN